jgi:hypothetical protein
MKKLFTLPMVILLTLSVFAQAPQKMSYQAVIRNSSGVLVINQGVGIKISILQGTPTGTLIYQEIYNPNAQTNANGLVSIEIGGGIPLTGTFSTINWANGPYYLKTETDPTGGTNYTISGTSQLLSVPYALHAKTAGTADYNTLSNLPALSITNWNTAFGWGNHSGLYRPIGYVPAWTEITGKPTFASVATSGNYGDLNNRPILGITGLSLENEILKITESSGSASVNLSSLKNDTMPFPGSAILSKNDQILLNNMIGNPNQRWKLCYKKSRDGSTSTTYHTLCDFRGPSVSVLMLANGYVLGGYCKTSTRASVAGYIADKDAFIFSITNKSKFPLGGSNDALAIYCNSSNGPTFGGGHDIYVSSTMTDTYCNFPYAYAYNGVTGIASNSASQFLCGMNAAAHGTITELEVWIQDW